MWKKQGSQPVTKCNRLKMEGTQLVTNYHQLKIEAENMQINDGGN